MARIKLAIVGVGNCASSLVLGIHFYRGDEDRRIPGLLHWEIGGYRPGDLEIACALDVDVRKVGKDIAEAIFEAPNCTASFQREVPKTGVRVRMGPVLDGVAPHMSDHPEQRTFLVSDERQPSKGEVVEALEKSGAEVMLNYLPVGSEQAVRLAMDRLLLPELGHLVQQVSK